MDCGLIVTLKGGWGKHGNESLPGGFWGLRVEFWDNFFFQTASLDARIAMVGSDHPFDERMGRLGRKGVLGHNLGLGARKRLASGDRLKMGKISPKNRKDRRRSISTVISNDRDRIDDRRCGWKREGETYWHGECGHKSYKFRHKREKGATRGLPEVTHPKITLAQARLMRSSMGSGALVLGMIAPSCYCDLIPSFPSIDPTLRPTSFYLFPPHTTHLSPIAPRECPPI
ncbi:hypothetical protein AAG906_036922 [Vitis piasezkii]